MTRKRVLVGHDRPTREEFEKTLAELIAPNEEGRRPDVIICPADHHNWTFEGSWACWAKGCYDTPVYDYVEVHEREEEEEQQYAEEIRTRC